MVNASSGLLADRLRGLTTELRSLELELKAGETPDKGQLQEFRQVLDNARLTAWTVSELLNARETQQNMDNVLSFVVAERLRRATQMLRELAEDIEREGLTWQTSGVQNLFETVRLVEVGLLRLLEKHRVEFEQVTRPSR